MSTTVRVTMDNVTDVTVWLLELERKPNNSYAWHTLGDIWIVLERDEDAAAYILKFGNGW